MPRLTPTAQTTATCQRPTCAPVTTAAFTTPTPKKTSTKVPRNSPAIAGHATLATAARQARARHRACVSSGGGIRAPRSAAPLDVRRHLDSLRASGRLATPFAGRCAVLTRCHARSGHVGLVQVGAVHDRIAQVRALQRAAFELGLHELRADQPRVAHVRAIGPGPAHGGAGEVRSARVRPRKIGVPQARAHELRVLQARLAQVHAHEVGAAEIGPAQVRARHRRGGRPLLPRSARAEARILRHRAGEHRLGEIRSRKESPFEVGPGEVRLHEVGARQEGAAQARAFEAGIRQVRAAEVRPIEARIAQVRPRQIGAASDAPVKSAPRAFTSRR